MKTQVFEAFDLCYRLTIYGNIAHAVLQYILGFNYVDPKLISLAEKIH